MFKFVRVSIHLRLFFARFHYFLFLLLSLLSIPFICHHAPSHSNYISFYPYLLLTPFDLSSFYLPPASLSFLIIQIISFLMLQYLPFAFYSYHLLLLLHFHSILSSPFSIIHVLSSVYPLPPPSQSICIYPVLAPPSSHLCLPLYPLFPPFPVTPTLSIFF